MQDVAVLIAENLYLYVASNLDIFFNIDGRIVEGRLRFLLRCGKSWQEFREAANDTHTAPAAACRGLDDDRIADFFGYLYRFIFVFDDAIKARCDWHACGFHGRTRSSFIA